MSYATYKPNRRVFWLITNGGEPGDGAIAMAKAKMRGNV